MPMVIKKKKPFYLVLFESQDTGNHYVSATTFPQTDTGRKGFEVLACYKVDLSDPAKPEIWITDDGDDGKA